MSARAPSSSTLRLAATVLFLGVPLLAAGVIALNGVRIAETRALTERQWFELALLERRMERSEAPGAPSHDTTEAVWLDGASPALAAANLQQHLATILAGASARLTETQSVGLDADGTDRTAGQIPLRVSFEATNDALLVSLLAIETGLPLVDVRSLTVRSGAPGADPTLRVDLVAQAYTAGDVTP